MRLADKQTDQSVILRGARDFAEQSDIEKLMPSGGEFDKAVTNVINAECVTIYLAEHDGEVVGGLGIHALPFLWNVNLLEITELFFWCWPGAPTAALALLRTTINDAKTGGADLLTMARLQTSPAKLDNVYKRLGFHKTQTVYQRML